MSVRGERIAPSHARWLLENFGDAAGEDRDRAIVAMRASGMTWRGIAEKTPSKVSALPTISREYTRQKYHQAVARMVAAATARILPVTRPFPDLCMVSR